MILETGWEMHVLKDHMKSVWYIVLPGFFSETLFSPHLLHGSCCGQGWIEPWTFHVGPHGRVHKGPWAVLVGLGPLSHSWLIFCPFFWHAFTRFLLALFLDRFSHFHPCFGARCDPFCVPLLVFARFWPPMARSWPHEPFSPRVRGSGPDVNVIFLQQLRLGIRVTWKFRVG
jgi:hypothetical protein